MSDRDPMDHWSKRDLVGYCVNLKTILEAMEDAGIPRSQTLGREYTRAYDVLKGKIEKEEENEARNSETRDGSQERADTALSGRVRGVGTGDDRNVEAPVRREGLRSSSPEQLHPSQR